jgi:hypothetical protein
MAEQGGKWKKINTAIPTPNHNMMKNKRRTRLALFSSVKI